MVNNSARARLFQERRYIFYIYNNFGEYQYTVQTVKVYVATGIMMYIYIYRFRGLREP